MFRNLGPMELILILLVVVLIFGAAKLPQLGRGVGEGIREFKKAAKGLTENEEDNGTKEDVKKS